jgi:hypothetical protein
MAYFDLQEDLERLFGRRVDLVAKDGLHRVIRDQVLLTRRSCMRREELYLADLIDNARAVRGYLVGVTRERWDAEDILRDAVLYRMLLLGEIASALPDELRDRYPDVAWRPYAYRGARTHGGRAAVAGDRPDGRQALVGGSDLPGGQDQDHLCSPGTG